MSTYVVRFMKDVLGEYGRQSEICQGTLEVGLNEPITNHAFNHANADPLAFSGSFPTKQTAQGTLSLDIDIPGIGRLNYQAIVNSDFPIVQGTVLIAALFIVVANILVDIAYAYLDPRVRYS